MLQDVEPTCSKEGFRVQSGTGEVWGEGSLHNGTIIKPRFRKSHKRSTAEVDQMPDSKSLVTAPEVFVYTNTTVAWHTKIAACCYDKDAG